MASRVIEKMLSNEKYMGDALLQKTYTVDFLDKEISGIVPEILPFYIESRLRTIFSDLPDDFSFVCFGKTEDYCYYGDYDERINTSERSMVDMYNQVKNTRFPWSNHTIEQPRKIQDTPWQNG